jgi:hypothetical protein
MDSGYWETGFSLFNREVMIKNEIMSLPGKQMELEIIMSRNKSDP